MGIFIDVKDPRARSRSARMSSKLGSPGLTRRRQTNGLSGWLISTRFQRAACPIGVTVRVAPVYLVSGEAPHTDGSSKTGIQRAGHEFEVGLSGPHSETLDVAQHGPRRTQQSRDRRQPISRA